MTLQKTIEAVLPARLINAPRLQGRLKDLAEEYKFQLVNHEYFGTMSPFEFGKENKVKVIIINKTYHISITVNIY